MLPVRVDAARFRAHVGRVAFDTVPLAPSDGQR